MTASQHVIQSKFRRKQKESVIHDQYILSK